MLKRLAVAMLCLYASGAYAQQAAGASGKPTDARSYCQKMKSIEGLPEYATKLVVTGQAVVAAGKEDRTRIAAYFRLYAQGVDDPNRTLSKRVLERINTAVPRKDAYNQDTAVQNYAEWFAVCASEMRSEHGLSPGVAVFLNPLAPEVPKFFDAPPGNKAQAMREFLGPPGLGGLNDREIEARTGLAFNGINPRWVLPLAIAMDGSERFLPPYVKQAIASIGGFSQATVKAAQERQSIAQGTHPACQRIESSPLVARFVAAVQAGYAAKANTDPMNSLAGLRFDNRQGELTALIKRRVAEAAGSGGRPDMTRQSQLLQQYNIILENCAVRNVDSDTFLFFAANVITPDRVEQQREQTRRGGGTRLNYDGNKPNTVDGINSMWASLYAYMFDDGEQLAARFDTANVDELVAIGNRVVDQRPARAAAAEKEKYAGLRNLFAFSQNPALAPSFARCVEGEKPYQTRIAETIEVSAREATTVAEQKDYQDAAVFHKQNVGSVATAMCPYRPNFSTVMAQVNDVGAAMMLGKGEHLPR